MPGEVSVFVFSKPCACMEASTRAWTDSTESVVSWTSDPLCPFDSVYASVVFAPSYRGKSPGKLAGICAPSPADKAFPFPSVVFTVLVCVSTVVFPLPHPAPRSASTLNKPAANSLEEGGCIDERGLILNRVDSGVCRRGIGWAVMFHGHAIIVLAVWWCHPNENAKPTQE